MSRAVYTFKAILYAEDDLYVAECPDVGTASQGTTPAEAAANLKEATELFLEDFPLSGMTPPVKILFEVEVSHCYPE